MAAVALVAMNGARAKARDARRKADIKQMINALAIYYSNHNNYPNVSYGGNCGTALTGSDTLSVALVTDGLIASAARVPSNSGLCGDAYYAGAWNSGQNIAVLTKLENIDSNCVAAFTWYATGSYCDGTYIMTLP